MKEEKVIHKWMWVWDFEKEERWLNTMAQSGWVLTNESYEIRPQTQNREIGFEVIEKSSGRIVYTTGDYGYRQWDFKTIKILPDNNIEIVTGDMEKQILRYHDGQWQYEN